MKIQLIACAKVYREQFKWENFLGSDDMFALVESGRFAFESPEGRYEVKENEGALFRKNILYHREIIEPATLQLFRFQSNVPLFESDHVTFSDTTRIRSTLAMMEKLNTFLLKDEMEYQRHFFSDLVQQYALENEWPTSSGQRSDPKIERAITVIRESLGRKIALSEIGEETGLSYVQFLRRFRAYTGLSPSDYISAIRLQKAKNLLAGTDLLIRDIAALCGFENEYYFSNFFKKKFGTSPSAFRTLSEFQDN